MVRQPVELDCGINSLTDGQDAVLLHLGHLGCAADLQVRREQIHSALPLVTLLLKQDQATTLPSKEPYHAFGY